MSIVSKERTDKDMLVISPGGRNTYTAEYKHTIFLAWYSLGKPGANKLVENIETDVITGGRPSIALLRTWINEDFRALAVPIDEQVAKELENRMVAEKVEMLNRHAKVGVDLQNKAIKYLEDHADEMKVPMALKALIEGVRIERESRGIASALDKMLNKSDEDLFKEVMEIINKSPVEFEQIESTIEIDNGDENGL
jgi:hypothetical protein